MSENKTMSPRDLQDAILNGPLAADCRFYVHTNDMPKISNLEASSKDQAIARILNDSGLYRTSEPVMSLEVKKTLILRDRWRGIAYASSSDAAYAIKIICDDGRISVDFMQREYSDLLARLMSESLLSSVDRAALEALCKRQSSITAADVSRAVRGPWE